ncbi:MAG TPA: FKBP-type peptidyl-prolyl cis-trans isomerase N-terminal domain-containing protein, partial [Stenotrophomonas sp.]|nr:FKBP-type peptidyl-prolyl cis-trans isomerase N-terminal domain-containing protein [Stenotrophomonas sp.]
MKMAMRGAAASLMIVAMAASAPAMSQQTAAPAATKEKSALNTEKEKVSYAIGMDIARSFEPVADYIDTAAMQRAIENAFKGGQPLLGDEQAQATDAALRTALAARNGQQVPGLAPGAQPPAVNKQNVGLMLGDRMVGPSLVRIKDDIDLGVLVQGLQTSLSKGTTLLSAQEAQATLQAFGSSKQAAASGKNREQGNAF